mmetsp:Transcript_8103/g.22587  ORF Transcript_8103/g.22587 Transcript_8103/m.22587 type:complete len:243 (-) Transcript_8103:292-1020(-)
MDTRPRQGLEGLFGAVAATTIMVPIDLCQDAGTFAGAAPSLGRQRAQGIVLRQSILDVVQGKLNGRTIAAARATAIVRVLHASEELLRRGRARGAATPVDLLMHLKHLGGGHSPARAASALVHDLLGRLQRRPVHELLRQRHGGAALAEEGGAVAGAGASARGGSPAPAPERRELLLGAVRELVDARCPEASRSRVVRLDLHRAAREQRQALAILLRALHVSAGVPLHEGVEACHGGRLLRE